VGSQQHLVSSPAVCLSVHGSIFYFLIVIKVRSMMEEGGLVLHCSDINTRSRAEGLPALAWRSDFIPTAVPPFY